MSKYTIMVLVLLTGILAGENINDQYSEFGDLIYYNMETAPFPHEKRAEGHYYKDEYYNAEDHYMNDQVAVFIPKGFKMTRKTDIVIHFHGWRNNIDSVLSRFQLIEQFSNSNVNAILVVPQGPLNAPDSFGGKLEDENGFNRFITELLKKLYDDGEVSSRKPGDIILSGHSGGYHVIAYILLRGGMNQNIKEIFLFDGLYGQTEKYCHWLEEYNGKFITIFTEDGGTKSECETMMEDFDYWNIPYYFCDENNMVEEQLKNNSAVFIYSHNEHNEVIHKNPNFYRFLIASQLKSK